MKHAVCSIIRLIAAALVVFGGLEIGWEAMRHRVQHAETNLWHYLIGSLLIVVGIILFAASSNLAAQLTDEDDDEPPPPPDLTT